MKVNSKRGVGTTPGFGQNQNPGLNIRASLSDKRKINYKGGSLPNCRIERCDDPATGTNQDSRGDNNQISMHRSVALATKGYIRSNCHVSVHDDPRTGPNSLERIGEPERFLLLTETCRNEPSPAIKPSTDDLEAGKPSTREMKPLSNYEKMAEIRKQINEIKRQQENQTGSKLDEPRMAQLAELERKGPNNDLNGCQVQTCSDPIDQKSGPGAPARQHCANDPSWVVFQGLMGWYGTSHQSIKPKLDDPPGKPERDEAEMEKPISRVDDSLSIHGLGDLVPKRCTNSDLNRIPKMSNSEREREFQRQREECRRRREEFHQHREEVNRRQDEVNRRQEELDHRQEELNHRQEELNRLQEEVRRRQDGLRQMEEERRRKKRENKARWRANRRNRDQEGGQQ